MSIGKKQNGFGKSLFRSKQAFFSILIIAIMLFCALFGYLIISDNSTHANRIIPAIAAKKSGFTIQLLTIQNTDIVQQPESWWQVLLHGKKDLSTHIPIINYSVITTDSITYTEYIDDDVTEVKYKKINHFSPSQIRTVKFYLGTDKFGRDILSRLILGTRVSISVGLIAVMISLVIGIFLGSLAGFYGGIVDGVISWLINVVWSIPTLLLVFAVTFILGKGFWQVFIAIGLTMWVNVARLVRGQVMAIKQLEYIEAAKVLGFSNIRIIGRHILPNIMGPVVIIAAANFASAIVIEAGLSFLGVGVQPPMPSWGLMIKENYNFIITNSPTLALAPGLAIMLAVLSFNLLGNALRDFFDVRDSN